MLKAKNAHAIDSYIRDRLLELNQKGLYTYWSCSGLYEDHDEAHHNFSLQPTSVVLSSLTCPF